MYIQSLPVHHRRHHGARRFSNLRRENQPVPFWKAMSWLAGRVVNRKQNDPPPFLRSDARMPAVPPAGVRLTWIGHSSFLLQTGPRNILLDPTFSDRASPLRFSGPKRVPPLPLALDDLPPIDIVILSHDHYDHLDRRTVTQLARQFDPLFLAPLNVGPVLRSFGASRVLELDWWQFVEIDDLSIYAAPAEHFSGRGIFNRAGTLWASWYIVDRESGARIYFGGDSAYSDHFRFIRDVLGPPDVAMLPIGAYLPRWFMQGVHVDPAEALQAYLDLEARYFVPMHWGTFDLAEEQTHVPIQELQRVATERDLLERVVELAIGQSWELPPGAETPASTADGGRSKDSDRA